MIKHWITPWVSQTTSVLMMRITLKNKNILYFNAGRYKNGEYHDKIFTQFIILCSYFIFFHVYTFNKIIFLRFRQPETCVLYNVNIEILFVFFMFTYCIGNNIRI